jgi:hypothetical protein
MSSSVDLATMMEAVLEAAFEVYLGRRIRFHAEEMAPLDSGAELVAAFRRAGADPVWASVGAEALHPSAALTAAGLVLAGDVRIRPVHGSGEDARRLLLHLVRRRVVLAPLDRRSADVIVLSDAATYEALLDAAYHARHAGSGMP